MTRLEYYRKNSAFARNFVGVSDDELIRRVCPPPGYFRNNKRPTKNCNGVLSCHKCWNTKRDGGVVNACTLSNKV